ncbi:FG-GAP-like repeat-containing protein [Streptomyces sp. NPDC056144]|uniref:FG-GAP-like repeat-containing protein n=1 Tax=unclassified Streptomyces TaxID=2593676 RepID=UPI0035DA6F13
MSRTSRTSHIRLAAALAVTASLTVGALATVPAVAATATGGAVAASADDTATVLPFPKDTSLWGSGPEGYATKQYNANSTVQRWTRHRDGVTTVLPAGTYDLPSPQSDIVPQTLGNGRYAMHDMSAGTVLQLDISSLGAGYQLAAYAGADIVAKKANATGGTDLHVIGKRAGVLVDDIVTGLPADTVINAVTPQGPSSVLVRYSATVNGAQQSRLAIVDTPSHAVTEQYDVPANATGSVDVSATHIAWIEKPSQFKSVAAVTPRRTTATKRYALGPYERYSVWLVGDWLTYATTGNVARYPFRVAAPLMAQSLTVASRPVPLLDNTVNAAESPDGTLLVRGGTFDQGEGLYRIDPRDGATQPPATLVASSGQSTNLTLVSQAASGTFALDRPGTPTTLSWKLSFPNSRVRVEVTHKATGKTWIRYPDASGADEAHRISWTDLAETDEGLTPLPNGDYTWHLTARYFNANGPALDKKGAFTIARKTVPHDFNDNGSPDLLDRDDAGQLNLFNTPTPVGTRHNVYPQTIGTGWSGYDRLLTPGNIGGARYPDLVARDRTGVLWLHQGTGRGGFSTRTKIGGGWNAYTQLTAGGDFTNNGKPDLLAVDKTGRLWLYKGTGDATRPFTSPTKIGTGYGGYNKIVATGDITGAPAGDLVARDKDGVLWLHSGKGDGTFNTRTRISGGWNEYSNIIGIGDLDHDGRGDLVGIRKSDNVPIFRKGTGDWRALFKAGTRVYANVTHNTGGTF